MPSLNLGPASSIARSITTDPWEQSGSLLQQGTKQVGCGMPQSVVTAEQGSAAGRRNWVEDITQSGGLTPGRRVLHGSYKLVTATYSSCRLSGPRCRYAVLWQKFNGCIAMDGTVLKQSRGMAGADLSGMPEYVVRSGICMSYGLANVGQVV